MIEIGVDVARFGSDLSVIAVRDDTKILPLYVLKKTDTMELTGNIINIAREFRPDLIKIDEIGVGGGVVDRLKEQHYNAIGIMVSRAALDTEHFANLRAEIWWNLRMLLDPKSNKNIILPNDDELLADLSSVQFKYNSRGQIAIEEKEEMKKRTNRSPDRGDAVAIAFGFAPSYADLWDPGFNATARFGKYSYKGLI